MVELAQEIAICKEIERRKAQVIVRQYTECTRVLNTLFDYAPDLCHSEDGVGCCGIGKEYAEDGIQGPAALYLIEMRNARLAEERIGLRAACPYHKESSGCILGELKSPRCASHYCEGILDKTSYDARYVLKTLETILAGRFDAQAVVFPPPEKNWDLVKEFKGYVAILLEEVKAIQANGFNVCEEI